MKQVTYPHCSKISKNLQTNRDNDAIKGILPNLPKTVQLREIQNSQVNFDKPCLKQESA
jgi:hypothetical protein